MTTVIQAIEAYNNTYAYMVGCTLVVTTLKIPTKIIRIAEAYDFILESCVNVDGEYTLTFC